MLQGKGKINEVANLICQLEGDLKGNSLTSGRRDEILAQLKAYGRDPRDADPIFSRSGISTLGAYTFGSFPSSTTREASRCIANALLLLPRLRLTYASLGYAEKCADKLKLQNDDDEFLASRTLFLLTFEPQVDFNNLFETQGIAGSITAHLKRHARQLSKGKTSHEPSPMETMALIETLKLLFSLSNAFPKRQQSLLPTIRPLYEILRELPILKPPLQPPVSSTINALSNIELSEHTGSSSMLDAVFPPSSENAHIDRLVDILSQAVTAYKPIELDSPQSTTIPLLMTLRKVYEFAPAQCKLHMQELLLPSAANRDLPIGKSEDLPSRLLRLTTSSGLLNLSECISALMYELSGKDANTYVKNVGYGFAAGYLVSHNIPVPDSAKNTQEEGNGKKNEIFVNLVTGQRLDREMQVDEPEMTEEEKEREAERLFVLFERLKATGVVDVENPLQQAMKEGKFEERIEELSDSD